MKYNFCTLFDTHYLSRGVALYASLEKHHPDFHIYIFAFNQKAYDTLLKLKFPKATIISLQEFEDEELLKVKPTRSIAEYCWTSTSSTVLYVLKNYNVDSCTYVDSDICFYSSPEPIFEEMGDASILITEHKYSPQYNKEVKSGKYCVQFVTFKNDERALKALTWWREKCIEWCYARYEDGKFGDQLYLDDWTTRFEGVHVLKHPGGGLAAWNVQQYNFIKVKDKITGIIISTGKKFDVIFYHFHYLRFIGHNVELGRRFLTPEVLEIFYLPYIKKLMKIKEQLSYIDNSFDPNGTNSYSINWKTPFLFIYRKINGIYNIFKLEDFLRK